MRIAPSLLVAVVVMAGCKKGDGILVVNVTAMPALSGVASLHGTAKTALRTVMFDVAMPSGVTTLPPPQSFGIDVPPSVAGTIEVTLAAMSSSGAMLSSAVGTTNVTAGAKGSLDLIFGPGTLTIDPPSGSCGQSPVNTVSAMTASFTITNTGDMPTGAPMVSTSDPQFTATGCTDVIAPGASCSVTVQFQPTAEGAQSATLTVDASPGGSVMAMVSGTGLKGSTLSFNPASYAFPPPATMRGNSGGTKTLTLTNAGTTASPTLSLTVTGANASSFMLMNDACSGTSLPASGTCEVTVQFAPTVSGSLMGVVTAKDPSNVVVASATISGMALGIWTKEMATGVTGQLNGVWGVNAGSVYVVGSAGIILHRDATGAWTSSQSLTGTSAPDLTGIWGSSATDLWASASTGVYRSTGNGTWVQAGNVSGAFYGVWGSAANDVYAVGPGVYHYPNNDINPWPQVCCGVNNAPLYGIFGTAANDVYVTGQSGSSMLIYHYNGTTPWIAQQGGIMGISGLYQLFAVWAASATNVFISGESQSVLHSTGNGTWTLVTTQGGARYFALWGSSGSDVYAVGESGAYAHFDGVQWTYPAPFTTSSLRGIWGTGPNNIYVVGDGGTIYHYY